MKSGSSNHPAKTMPSLSGMGSTAPTPPMNVRTLPSGSVPPSRTYSMLCSTASIQEAYRTMSPDSPSTVSTVSEEP